MSICRFRARLGCDHINAPYKFTITTDDAKLFKHILSESDEQQLQEGINELHVWTKNWLLNLNISKRKAISFGRTFDKSHTYNITDSDVMPIDRVNIIKDLGILIDEKLTFRDHIHDKINKAYMMFGLTRSSSIAERPRDASCC